MKLSGGHPSRLFIKGFQVEEKHDKRCHDLGHPNTTNKLPSFLPSFLDKWLTLRSVSSLDNPQNSELKICKNMKLAC
jgi:hypothetical protein